MWKSCRKNSLRFDLVPEKGDDEVRDGAQAPRRSVHLGRPRRNLGGLAFVRVLFAQTRNNLFCPSIRVPF